MRGALPYCCAEDGPEEKGGNSHRSGMTFHGYHACGEGSRWFATRDGGSPKRTGFRGIFRLRLELQGRPPHASRLDGKRLAWLFVVRLSKSEAVSTLAYRGRNSCREKRSVRCGVRPPEVRSAPPGMGHLPLGPFPQRMPARVAAEPHRLGHRIEFVERFERDPLPLANTRGLLSRVKSGPGFYPHSQSRKMPAPPLAVKSTPCVEKTSHRVLFTAEYGGNTSHRMLLVAEHRTECFSRHRAGRFSRRGIARNAPRAKAGSCRALLAARRRAGRFSRRDVAQNAPCGKAPAFEHCRKHQRGGLTPRPWSARSSPSARCPIARVVTC